MPRKTPPTPPTKTAKKAQATNTKSGVDSDTTEQSHTRNTRTAHAHARIRRSGQHPTVDEAAESKAVFLKEFEGSGNITTACRRAGIGRTTFYRWKEEDGAFLIAYRYAEEQSNDILELAARQRALVGVERVVVSMGKVVYVADPDDHTGIRQIPLTQREYSDAILLRMLQAHNPKYHTQSKVDITSGGERIASVAETVQALLASTEGEQAAQDVLNRIATRPHRQPRR
jgi:hypothetical protein